MFLARRERLRISSHRSGTRRSSFSPARYLIRRVSGRQQQEQHNIRPQSGTDPTFPDEHRREAPSGPVIAHRRAGDDGWCLNRVMDLSGGTLCCTLRAGEGVASRRCTGIVNDAELVAESSTSRCSANDGAVAVARGDSRLLARGGRTAPLSNNRSRLVSFMP